MAQVDLVRIKAANIDDLIAYSERKLWKPHYPKALVHRFLTELVSSDEMIIDLHDINGRVAAAVLLDRVNNPANDACLEILGVRNGADPRNLFSELVRIIRKISPERRAGFQVGLQEDSLAATETLLQLGLAHYYDTYEMRSDCSNSNSPDRTEIRTATLANRDEIYAVLCKAFAKSPDTSITDSLLWKAEFLRSSESHFYVWIEAGEVAGFANVVEDLGAHEVELRTVGVLEKFRGRGIGRHLLNHCLSESRRLGYKICRLTVGVTNEKALGLYLDAGFKTIEKFRCFRADFVR